MYATTTKDVMIAWVGVPINQPRVWPVVITHKNGFEPGILHEVGGEVWREDIPWRMAIADATTKASGMAISSLLRGRMQPALKDFKSTEKA